MMNPIMGFISLPVDIVILILETLEYEDLSTLSQTCKFLHTIVTDYGWTTYLRLNTRPSYSLSKTRDISSPQTISCYNVRTDTAWTKQHLIARPLSVTWFGKYQPVLAISSSRLIVGAGSVLYSYLFGTPSHSRSAPPVSLEGSVSLQNNPEQLRNITAITFIEDGGCDGTLDVAFQDGAIERIYLTPPSPSTELTITRYKLPDILDGDFVESLSSQADIVLALSSNGQARLSNTSFTSPGTQINIGSRSWTSYLSSPSSSSPFAAFGTASTTPLTVHSLLEGGQLSSSPTAILHSKKFAESLSSDKLPSSAVYGLCSGPPNAPWGASPQILVSGWYDGHVRVYDLRVPSETSCRYKTAATTNNTSQPDTDTSSYQTHVVPMHSPILTLKDGWLYEPIYSVSSGGGSGSHIAAGSARHSVVCFWDVRAPRDGWSVYAPGSDRSPVYSVILESSRLFGVTQSRPFVYDFGPGVTLDTYPQIPRIKGDNLKKKKGSDSVGYNAVLYSHSGLAVTPK